MMFEAICNNLQFIPPHLVEDRFPVPVLLSHLNSKVNDVQFADVINMFLPGFYSSSTMTCLHGFDTQKSCGVINEALAFGSETILSLAGSIVCIEILLDISLNV
jgi:hypothetical protein